MKGACGMTTRPKFLLNPVIILLTMVVLTLFITFAIGLNVRRAGDTRPTDQVYIERPMR